MVGGEGSSWPAWEQDTWSRTQGVVRMEQDTGSGTHGVGHREKDTRDKTQGDLRPQPTESPTGSRSQFPGRACHSPSAWRRSFWESGAFEALLGNADSAEGWAAPGTEQDSSRRPH